MLSYLLDDNPGAVGYIYEPTYRMVRRILIPTLELLLGYPIESNYVVSDFVKTESRIDFVNGSRLWFGGLENPEMAEGPNIDFIQVDEARLVRHFDVAWRVIQRRIRGSIPHKYKTGAYVTTTPDAPGSVLHSFFENPLTRDPQSHIYRMGLADNPHLSEDYIEGIKRSHHDGLAERFIHGRFAAVGAVTIPFDSAIHELATTDQKRLRQVVYGCDFGWTNPSAIVAVGFDGDDRAYALDEFYSKQVQIDVLAEELKQMQAIYGKGPVYCDSSEPRSISILRRAGLNAYANKTKREDGIHKLAGRFLKAGDGKPRIYVHTICRNLIAELQVYDEEVKEYDHAVDALRYAIMSRREGGIIAETGPGAWSIGRRRGR